MGCSHKAPPPPPPAPVPSTAEADKQLLSDAMHECFTLSCDDAIRKVSTLAPDSALRRTDEFAAIEYRRVAEELLAADIEPNTEKRRAMLQAIQGSASLPASLRTAATFRLTKLSAPAPVSFAVTFGGADAGTSNPAIAGGGSAATEPDLINVFDLAHTGKKGNLRKARTILEPKVASGRATGEEVKLLVRICKSLGDRACADAARKRLR
jgi:hypothetical protein